MIAFAEKIISSAIFRRFLFLMKKRGTHQQKICRAKNIKKDGILRNIKKDVSLHAKISIVDNMICEIFIYTHLDYGDIFTNQPNNAAAAFTGAKKRTSRVNIYQ